MVALAVGRRRAPQRQARFGLATRSVIVAVKPIACTAHAGFNNSVT
ncbi:hypothetical protein RR48_10323 [Papilio machaon]|uniref:Uncharacterized protein n=1 Tax=Papilio machaon TaxID=76193 RepID=A0A194RH07_PAPMA|nr:hypothetical protein RR48_10323 [Papilio machaon]